MVRRDTGAAADDPVVRRLARLLDAKRRQNERAVGTLDRLDESWEGMNKELDSAIDAEFKLVAADIDAVDRALEALKKPPSKKDHEGFSLGGKIVDPAGKVGVPNAGVRITHILDDGTEEILATTRTDSFGNLMELIPTDRLPPRQQRLNRVKVEAFRSSDPETFEEGTPFLIQETRVRLAPGEAGAVELAAEETTDITSKIAAGKSVKDSVVFASDTLARRLEKMTTSHTTLTRFSATTRATLQRIRKDLSAPTPDAGAIFGTGSSSAGGTGKASGGAGVDTPTDAGGDRPPGGRPSRPTDRPAQGPTAADREREAKNRLSRIRDIGEARARKLFTARIDNLEKFADATDDEIKAVLGDDVEVERMKTEARELTNLEAVETVGAARARKLREAGILDVAELAGARSAILRRVLGNVDAEKIKESSTAVLARIRGG